MFEDYYDSMTGETLPIAFCTFEQYFNVHLEFAFSLPRSDVCNMCFWKEQGSSMTVEENVRLKLHKSKVDGYNLVKSTVLGADFVPEVLILEFDYAQNLPLPKLPVNDQFYKRLLWMFIFNLHMHQHENLYMFHFMEGNCKKGANRVCLFVHDVIKFECNPEVRKINLFSDACLGQNRNWTMSKFLLSIAMLLNVEIQHTYPVRGHSYNQCDRNFALYSRKLKHLESIETPEEFADIVRNCRKVPFLVQEGIVYDYDALLNNFYKHPTNLAISKAAVLVYRPNGSIEVHQNYAMINPRTFNVIKGKMIPANVFDGCPCEATKPVADLKRKDFLSLLPYVKPCNHMFYLHN